MKAIERLRKAWKCAPTGAKTLVYKDFNQQNVNDILKRGRQDETIIEDLLKAIKEASIKVCKEVCEQSNQIQEL